MAPGRIASDRRSSRAGPAHRGAAARDRWRRFLSPPYLPARREYEFQAKTVSNQSLGHARSRSGPHQLEITVDGERVFLATVGGGLFFDFATLLKNVTAAGDAVDARAKVRVPVKKRVRETSASPLIYRSAVADTRTLQPFLLQLDRYLRLHRSSPRRHVYDLPGRSDGKGSGEHRPVAIGSHTVLVRFQPGCRRSADGA